MYPLMRKCSFCDGLGTVGIPSDQDVCYHCHGSKVEQFGQIDLSGFELMLGGISDNVKETMEKIDKLLEISTKSLEVSEKILEIVSK